MNYDAQIAPSLLCRKMHASLICRGEIDTSILGTPRDLELSAQKLRNEQVRGELAYFLRLSASQIRLLGGSKLHNARFYGKKLRGIIGKQEYED